MKLPYLLRRMYRRKKMCLFVCLIAMVTSTLLSGLHAGDLAMERKIQDVYDNTVVTCAVTNLTGTQSDHLDLPFWAVDLFLESSENRIHVPETSFLDYVKDVQMKTTMDGSLSGQSVDVVGITALSADPSLRPEETTITWVDGFDDTVFSGTQPVCLVTEDVYRSVKSTQKDASKVSVTIHGIYNREMTTELNFTIAGVCTGKQSTLYCPWEIAAPAYTKVNGSLHADCIYATIGDNRTIEEFRQRCAEHYFATVDPKGTPQLWESSPIYETYPFAMAIYDEMLTQTVSSLQKNQTIYRLCQNILVVLALGIGFVIGNLSTKQRQKEFALQYVMGLPKGRIFAELWVEHILVNGSGFVLGILGFWLLSGTTPPWAFLVSAFGAGCIGVALAAWRGLRGKDIAQLVKRGDSYD